MLITGEILSLVILFLIVGFFISILFGLFREVGNGDQKVVKSLWKRIVDSLKQIRIRNHG